MSLRWMEYRWYKLLNKYQTPIAYREPLWEELFSAYSNINRSLYGTDYILNMLQQMDLHHQLVEDFDTLELAVWYHRIVFREFRKDNLQKSAQFARYRLEAIKYPRQKLVRCYQHIMFLRHDHQNTPASPDTFLLKDLSRFFMGEKWTIYQKHMLQMRNQYYQLPDFLYIKCRIRAIKALLKENAIFLTPIFSKNKEQQARQNLHAELEELQRLKSLEAPDYFKK